jgi:hypothetical protein
VPVHQVCQNLTPPDWPTARLTPAQAHRAGLPERHNRATSRPALRARRSPASMQSRPSIRRFYAHASPRRDRACAARLVRGRFTEMAGGLHIEATRTRVPAGSAPGVSVALSRPARRRDLRSCVAGNSQHLGGRCHLRPPGRVPSAGSPPRSRGHTSCIQ